MPHYKVTFTTEGPSIEAVEAALGDPKTRALVCPVNQTGGFRVEGLETNLRQQKIEITANGEPVCQLGVVDDVRHSADELAAMLHAELGDLLAAIHGQAAAYLEDLEGEIIMDEERPESDDGWEAHDTSDLQYFVDRDIPDNSEDIEDYLNVVPQYHTGPDDEVFDFKYHLRWPPSAYKSDG